LGNAKKVFPVELDMHFSISQDLHPLEELLRVLRDGGLKTLMVYLERGTFRSA